MSQAVHGGAFFEAIGVDLRHLERASGVISADVLDAWFDPSPRVLALLGEHLSFLLRTSPPNHAEGFVAEIAACRGVPEECILPGAGSSSLLFTCLPRLLAPGVRALTLAPAYSEYDHICEKLLGGVIQHHEPGAGGGFTVDGDALLADVRRFAPDALLLVNPNNPTGRVWPRAELLRFLDHLPSTTLNLVDETYLEYAGSGQSLESEAARRENLIVVKSMSKVYALSGARVAYLVTSAPRTARLRPWLPPWPVGLLAQAAAMEALRDPSWYLARYAETRRLREALRTRLARWRPVESETNFFLIQPPDAAALAAALRRRQIFVREFPDGPLAGRYLRVAVKDAEQNGRLAAAFDELA